MKQIAVIMSLLLLIAGIGTAQEDVNTETATDTVAAETPAAETVAEEGEVSTPLDELAWMVGSWVDQGEESWITTRCAWTKNQKFLTRSFTVTNDGEVSLQGTQVVGWDPIAQQIRSWTFDSEGGFGQGRWIRDGDRWLVKTAFTLASGERASAVNVITYVDQDTFRWQSTAREIAGEVQPNIPEVTIVREPAEASADTPTASEQEVTQ